MDNASFQFVIFGLATALVSNLSRSRVWRTIVLSLASAVFLYLLAPNPLTLLPLFGFLLLGYAGLIVLEFGWSKSSMWSIIVVVLAYIWLKKYTFIPAGLFIHSPYFTLGLSYIVFRVLHLLIETGDSREKVHVGLVPYLLYTLNFTTLVSGPIQRYDEFVADQLADQPIALGPRVIGLQLERIVRGFFKVNVLAILLHAVQEDALAQMSQPLPLGAKVFSAFRMAFVYPFFLYANFSGYIDIVIALARLMRIRLPENFDRPFSSASVLEFWSRWHMTLSNWLKTYVYNPLLLGLMRRISSLSMQPFLGVFCFFFTFLLIGIWHGRTSEFVMFGIFTGGGISINKLWQIFLTRLMSRKGYNALAKNVVYRAFGRGLNFSWFAFSLFWMWGNWKEINLSYSALGIGAWLGVWMVIWITATIVLGIWEWLRAVLLSIKAGDEPILTNRYSRVVYATALGLASFIMTVLLNQPAPDIVYKAF